MKKDKKDCIERKKKDKNIWIDTILIKKMQEETQRRKYFVFFCWEGDLRMEEERGRMCIQEHENHHHMEASLIITVIGD